MATPTPTAGCAAAGCGGRNPGPADESTAQKRACVNQAVVVSLFLVLLTATAVLVWVSASSRNDAIQLALSRFADSKQTAMLDALQTWFRLADRVGRSMAVAPNTTAEAFLYSIASSSPELSVPAQISVSWAIPVANNPEAIAEYEAYLRRISGCATAAINFNLASNYSWRPPASEQPEFLPFTQSNFGDSAAAACAASTFGFDLIAIDETNVERRATALAARALGQALATPPIDTTGSTVEYLGTIQSIFAPVFLNAQFAGIVSAAFSADDLAAAGAIDLFNTGVHTTLTDVESGVVLSQDGDGILPQWFESRNLTLGGRTWLLDVTADAEFADVVPNEALWASLLACVLVVGVGALVLARVRDEAVVAKATKRLLLQMSHDLRTPLHSIWHAAQELADLQGVHDNPDATQPIETLEWCVALAKNILDNILDMSHISKGTLSATNVPGDVLAILTAAVHIMRATAEDRGTELQFVGEQTGQVCMVDNEKLLRVVLNIIGNAVKFTPGGLVQVHVSLGAAEPGANAAAPGAVPKYVLTVAVRDNGCGMDAATLATATRAYAHASRSDGGGSGIGLHVAKTIVEQYGGALKLSSAGPKLGSTVSFSMMLDGASPEEAASFVKNATSGTSLRRPLSALNMRSILPVSGTRAGGASTRQPCRRQRGDVSIPVREVDEVGGDSNAGGTAGGASGGESAGDDGGDVEDGAAKPVVLVVDDSRMNRRVAVHALRPLKCRVAVEQCVDGEEALARLQALTQEAPERHVLCLMDQSMPKMGGSEATRRYRAWAAAAGTPRGQQAWICVLTGDVVTSRKYFQGQGFDHMLTKPCPADTLRRVLAEQINARQSVAPRRPQPASELGGTIELEVTAVSVDDDQPIASWGLPPPSAPPAAATAATDPSDGGAAATDGETRRGSSTVGSGGEHEAAVSGGVCNSTPSGGTDRGWIRSAAAAAAAAGSCGGAGGGAAATDGEEERASTTATGGSERQTVGSGGVCNSTPSGGTDTGWIRSASAAAAAAGSCGGAGGGAAATDIVGGRVSTTAAGGSERQTVGSGGVCNSTPSGGTDTGWIRSAPVVPAVADPSGGDAATPDVDAGRNSTAVTAGGEREAERGGGHSTPSGGADVGWIRSAALIGGADGEAGLGDFTMTSDGEHEAKVCGGGGSSGNSAPGGGADDGWMDRFQYGL